MVLLNLFACNKTSLPNKLFKTYVFFPRCLAQYITCIPTVCIRENCESKEIRRKKIEKLNMYLAKLTCVALIKLSVASGRSLRRNQRSSRLNALRISRTCSSITSSHSTRPLGIELMWVNGCLKMSDLLLHVRELCFPEVNAAMMYCKTNMTLWLSISRHKHMKSVLGWTWAEVTGGVWSHVTSSVEGSLSRAQHPIFSCINTNTQMKHWISHVWNTCQRK